jgi:hypothetical protein
MQSHDIGHQISVLSKPSNEYKIKTTFLGQTQEIELCIRDKSLTKKTSGSFIKKRVILTAFTLNDPPL